MNGFVLPSWRKFRYLKLGSSYDITQNEAIFLLENRPAGRRSGVHI